MDRGYGDQLQLPFGFNVNYVNAFIDLEITDFGLNIGGRDFTNVLNTETLNFTGVNATTNGLNYRADAWILPFINVYGLLSIVTGGTNVSFQPTWKDAVGDVILELPEFSSNVAFDAMAYGIGATSIFGWDGHFLSTDINYSKTNTELLKEQVGYLTLSARIGHRFMINKNRRDQFIAPYVGVMYRNFVGPRGSTGSINMDEVFPEAQTTFDTKVDEKIASNQQEIANLTPGSQEWIKLKAENQALNKIRDEVDESGVFTTQVDYSIKKDLVQTMTFQFGFNFQFNKHWMLRGEYGIADSQRMIFTGLVYRFGIKNKAARN